jgi:UDP-N-acetylglucosamine 2-epimerase (non-hydrolysing)
MKKKVLFVFGTRPEAIKLAPVIKKMKENDQFFDVAICVTGQHKQMLEQVLSYFNLKPDFNLKLMKDNQTLHSLTASIIEGVGSVIKYYKPSFLIVHGDTTTTFAASLSAFYEKIKICHVEAGLRTWQKYSPFPEEINRRVTSLLADYHFAPTERSKSNLIKEGVGSSSIVVTGNTVIDSLFISLNGIENSNNHGIEFLKTLVSGEKKILLVTGHRRENFGESFLNICEAIKSVAINYSDQVTIVYPVHLNPNVQKPVFELLSGYNNILLIEPLDYLPFVWLMSKSYLILTDSGGIQEEAPALGKPVLVFRDTTERPEAIESGGVKLIGTSKNVIINEVSLLLDDSEVYNSMSKAVNPYGDGNASQRISDFLIKLN